MLVSSLPILTRVSTRRWVWHMTLGHLLVGAVVAESSQAQISKSAGLQFDVVQKSGRGKDIWDSLKGCYKRVVQTTLQSIQTATISKKVPIQPPSRPSSCWCPHWCLHWCCWCWCYFLCIAGSICESLKRIREKRPSQVGLSIAGLLSHTPTLRWKSAT